MFENFSVSALNPVRSYHILAWGHFRVFKQLSNKFVFNKLLFTLFQRPPPCPGRATDNQDTPARHFSRLGRRRVQGLRSLCHCGPGSRVAGALPASCFLWLC